MSLQHPITVVGGGIAGLAAGLALAQHGISSQILERGTGAGLGGAGIQFGPNATRCLARLGVLPQTQARACRPDAIVVFDGLSSQRLADLPLGNWISLRHGADYLTAHRADVHDALLAAVLDNPLIEMIFAFEVSRIVQKPELVEVWNAGGESRRGHALIGADGIWSAVRKIAFGAPPLESTGKTAARTVVSMAQVPKPLAGPIVGVWMGRRAHVVHYPVRNGAELAIIAVVADDWSGEGWGHRADAYLLQERFAEFGQPLQSLLAEVEGWRKWALYDPPAMPRSEKGRITLLGDAAHPILPFLAQGAALALEEAIVLADAIAEYGSKVEAAFAHFERTCRGRAARVQAAARRNGRIYHLSGLPAQVRNLVLRTTPGSVLMSRYDWLYKPRPRFMSGTGRPGSAEG